MKHKDLIFLITLFAFITFLLNSGDAASQIVYEKDTYVTKQGDTLPYRILYPENYDPGKKYPLILFLHGRGERGKDNELQLTYGSRLFIEENYRKRFPAIVIFPQCPETSSWTSANIDRTRTPFLLEFNYHKPQTWPLKASVELVRKFIKNVKADRDQIYIIGLSMGGMGTLEAVARNPKLFAAAVPICGGGDTTFYKCYTQSVALWLFHGAEDQLVSPEYSRAIVAVLKASGAPYRYTEYPGVGHDSWNNTFAEPELLSWMFKQKKR